MRYLKKFDLYWTFVTLAVVIGGCWELQYLTKLPISDINEFFGITAIVTFVVLMIMEGAIRILYDGEDKHSCFSKLKSLQKTLALCGLVMFLLIAVLAAGFNIHAWFFK